jgi:hypothetical protein
MENQPGERMAVVGTIDPFNGNNATTLSDAVDMSKFHEAVFILSIGANDSTVDFKLTESATSGGSYTDITGKAITQEAGGDDDNKQWVISLKSEELSSGKQFVKASVTIGNGTTNLISLVALGLRPRFAPASDDDLASVSQIVT